MSRAEAFAADRLDRSREREEAKQERTARSRHLEERARAYVLCEIGEMPAEDRAEYACAMTRALAAQLVLLKDAPFAVAFLGKEAGLIGRGIMPRQTAHEAAERVFQPKAANDGGEE